MDRRRAATLAQQTASSLQAREAIATEAVLAAGRIEAAGRLRLVEARVQQTARQALEEAMAQRAAEDEIARREAALTAMLPLALRLSLFPAETLLAAPAAPGSAVEGLLAARGIAAELASEVAALGAAQEKSRALAASLARSRSALGIERSRQMQAAAALDRQIGQADRAQARALDEAGIAALNAATLAAQAQDLRGAIAAMDAAEQRTALAASRAARQQRGVHASKPARAVTIRGAATPRIALVAGQLSRAWGTPAEDGPATGVTFSAAPGAYVSSPCRGRVVFAAPFRSYGRLMIIECGGSADFVLAGMERLDARVGRDIQEGEPVGRMPQEAAPGSGTPLLYVELRKNGTAVDPMPYLNGKP